MLSVITSLEFFQHYFSEMGHRDLLVTQIYLKPSSNQRSPTSREASAAGRLRPNEVIGKWEIDLQAGRPALFVLIAED